MPMFGKSLEKTLHEALHYAANRQHEYATLEHLLLALVDDDDASAVMAACGVDLDELGQIITNYLDTELNELRVSQQMEKSDPSPTAGFQRVIQRAILHVQSSGKDVVTGANVLVALFSEKESYAVYFLQQQDMSRLDAVSYISHGIGKNSGQSSKKQQSEKAESEKEDNSEARNKKGFSPCPIYG